MTTEAMRAAFEAWCAIGNPSYRSDDDSTVNRRDWRVWQAATLAERERCAKVCDELDRVDRPGHEITASDCAAAIRRGTLPADADDANGMSSADRKAERERQAWIKERDSEDGKGETP